jgi:VanZ family protein
MNSLLRACTRPGALLHVAPAVLSVVLVFYLGTRPPGEIEMPRFRASDKVGHVLAFAFVHFTHFRAARFLAAGLGGSRSSSAASRDARACVVAAMSSVAVGGLLELWQATLPYRSAEWADLLADALGVGMSSAVLLWAGSPEAT